MTNAKAAVFDLGNVLLQWNPEAYYDAVIGPERRKAFFDRVPVDTLNDRSDLGEDLSSLVREFAPLYPDWEREIQMWWEDWPKICAPEIPGSVDLLKRLKERGVPVYSLTNFGVETLNIATRTYPFLSLFDREFVSGHLQVMKPDDGIYEALEKGTGLTGSDLIFADDRADNIAAAKARGWQTHLFEHPEGWELALIRAGLLEAG